jgi:hypothetical protein
MTSARAAPDRIALVRAPCSWDGRAAEMDALALAVVPRLCAFFLYVRCCFPHSTAGLAAILRRHADAIS